MVSTPLPTTYLLTATLSVILLETGAAFISSHLPFSRIGLIGMTRIVQMAAVVALAIFQAGGPVAIGLNREDLLAGLKKGLVWSAGFAVFAALLFAGLWVAGQNPLIWVRSPLPGGSYPLVRFFLVGGVVAPIAEEIFFRGVVFGYLLRWGPITAVLVSTLLFAAIHAGPAVPLTQIVGGIVFAISYHLGKSLVVPITIHILGNLAIFTLSLIPIG